MYARYVPPSRASQAHPEVHNPPAETAAVPEETITQTSGYARYVPKPRAQMSQEEYPVDSTVNEAPTSEKKRKRDEAEVSNTASTKKKSRKSQGAEDEETIDLQTVESQESSRPAKKEKKKRNKKRRTLQVDSDFDSDDEQDSKKVDVPDTTTPADAVNDTLPEPLPQTNNDDLVGEPQGEKRKKKKKNQDVLEPQDDQDVEMEDSFETPRSPKKPKKEKKSKTRETEPEDEKPMDPRHKALLEKKSEALRRSKLTEDKTSSVGLGILGNNEDAAEAGAEQHELGPLPQPEPAVVDTSKPAYSTLPAWLASPTRVSTSHRTPFADLGMPAPASRFLELKGYPDAFAVQTAAIPLLTPSSKRLPGDLLIAAATGSGKTLAYALPVCNDLSQGVVTRLRALVVLPTRELVRQAREVFDICSRAFAEESGRKRLKVGIAVGSQMLKQEQDMLVSRDMRFDYSALDAQATPSKEQDSDTSECDDALLPGHVWEYSSKVDVLICTPGRLVEHMEQTPGFSLDYVRWLVVDEADKLLAQSFQGWLETVMDKLRSEVPGARAFANSNFQGVRKILLSATLTRDLSILGPLHLRRPQLIVLENEDGAANITEHSLPDLLHESAVRVHEPSLKPLYLLELIQKGHLVVKKPSAAGSAAAAQEEPADSDDSSSDESSSESSSDSDSENSSSGSDTAAVQPAPPKFGTTVLIFTKSNESALRLSRLLSLLLPALAPLIGTLTSTTPTHARRKTLRAFGARKLRLLVASDLVARGIDLPQLDHVVNYDLPASVAAYVHRVGRTARAGQAGRAWTLLPDAESGWFWGKIAKGAAVRRAHKVERVRIGGEGGEFAEEVVAKYQAALETLGKEAHEMRRK